MTDTPVEEHIEAIREHMKSLCDLQRVFLMKKIMQDYCVYCSSKLNLHRCYCQYDDKGEML